ncbi:hypothetical protein R3P38DRAFT_2607824 [Favolaschia claudopus]|uniref:Uncharacterized protein n=1 Tax=Favolaschia claudopus TaxID=2862362 RepID=A0AAW0D8J6_9AGAR
MGVHFYDTSPSGPSEQRGRLTCTLPLVKANIPCVVWGEDALSIVHFVPTCLFTQHLIVPDSQVANAAQLICSHLPYTREGDARNEHWIDLKFHNPACAHAFDIEGGATIELFHNDVGQAVRDESPTLIFVHSASTVHFDIGDPSRTMLNPEPPGPEFASIRFPNAPAFYDMCIDAYHEGPHPFVQFRLRGWLTTLISYLNLYTVSNKGETFTIDETTQERILLPSVSNVVARVKEENRPMLLRRLLHLSPLHFPHSVLERRDLKQERMQRLGQPYKPPTGIPYDRFSHKEHPEPRLTPFLLKKPDGGLHVQWRPLARYLSLAKRMAW